MQHHRFTARELQFQAVIGEIVHAGLQMQQQCLHIAHPQVVLQGMVEQGLQRVGVLLFHHGMDREIQTLWISASVDGLLQLVSTDARQLFTAADFQRSQYPQLIAQSHRMSG